MKLEFPRQIFEKYSNIKFHKNPTSGSRVVPCGWTDRHDEANSLFSQFCEHVYWDSRVCGMTRRSFPVPWVRQHCFYTLLWLGFTVCSVLWWCFVYCKFVKSSWNVMAHGDALKGKWRGNWRMEWVASTLHTTSEHGVSSITTADALTSAARSRLNWPLRRFKWTRPFRWNMKSGFCPCAITFQLACTR